MKRFEKFLYSLHPYLLSCISAPLTVAQIVLAFVIRQPRSETLQWIGWILWWTSAIFGWLPILTLLQKGGVPKGKSYVHTTTLVETGVYAIVRHPQMGTAWLLMCTGLMFITQHWISIALGVPAMALAYLDVLKADQGCIEKFGDAYRRYMERVPRVNFVAGIVRLIMRRAGGK
ncbi:MAG: isoprenylcysteine carboxylmethyltransferase family protein [Anaerolineae bacterium]|nr:isoprenylcysteine carboxylmethyltransferase family protein [Anaerolineae bacterium]